MKYLFFIVLFLAGCGIIPIERASPELMLLIPEAGPEPVLIKQVITLTKGDEKRKFLTVMRLTKNTIQFVALLPTGQKLMSFQYDGERFSQQGGFASTLPGRDILALIQLALWPVESISDRYERSSEWRFVSSGNQRKLWFGEVPAVTILDDQGSLVIKQHIEGYTINVLTLSKVGA